MSWERWSKMGQKRGSQGIKVGIEDIIKSPPPLFCLKLLIGLFLYSHHPLFHFISPICYQLHSRLLLKRKSRYQGRNWRYHKIININLHIHIKVQKSLCQIEYLQTKSLTPPPLFCLKLLIGLFLYSHHPLFHFISPVCYQLHSRLYDLKAVFSWSCMLFHKVDAVLSKWRLP
jgi:hypothetical protein